MITTPVGSTAILTANAANAAQTTTTVTAQATTTLSTKGQVVVPKAFRDALGWPDGITLAVEQLASGVLLSAAKHHFAPTRPQNVRGCMQYKGSAMSIDEIDQKSRQAFVNNWKRNNA